MSNPTSNFGWQMPTPTDLVTSLPADFEVFGQAVDSSMADLKGGTSGQILSKNSNTDMDFVWIENDQGDITAVNVTSPITGGGSAGAVTVGIQDALTTQKGAVQLSDSTSTTSSILAATPTAVKSAYDLAAAAIPKSTVTTAGDLIVGTGSSTVTRLGIGTNGQVLSSNGTTTVWSNPASGMTNPMTTTGDTIYSSSGSTPARLGIGSSGQVLTVAGGVPSWATPAGSKVLQIVYGSTSTQVNITTATMTDSGITATITPTSASSKILVQIYANLEIGRASNTASASARILRDATVLNTWTSNFLFTQAASSTTGVAARSIVPVGYLDSPATTSAVTYKLQGCVGTTGNTPNTTFQQGSGLSTIVLMEVVA